MQAPVDFLLANPALALANPYRIVADQRPDCREPELRAISPVGFHPDAKTCGPPRTGTVGPASERRKNRQGIEW